MGGDTMRWHGETLDQRIERRKSGRKYFALFPTQMEDGQWIWLEKYWSVYRRIDLVEERWRWHNFISMEDAMRDRGPKTPPPPKMRGI
jgi:hypothetical protein